MPVNSQSTGSQVPVNGQSIASQVPVNSQSIGIRFSQRDRNSTTGAAAPESAAPERERAVGQRDSHPMVSTREGVTHRDSEPGGDSTRKIAVSQRETAQ